VTQTTTPVTSGSLSTRFEDEMLDWSSLADDVYKQRWINEVRMTEEVFTELLHLV
jgi:hypothetical protein